MDKEENQNTEHQKISALLEEAAKRHREIEQKIHPEKYQVKISVDPEPVKQKEINEKTEIHKEPELKKEPEEIVKEPETQTETMIFEVTAFTKKELTENQIPPPEKENSGLDPENLTGKDNLSSGNLISMSQSLQPAHSIDKFESGITEEDKVTESQTPSIDPPAIKPISEAAQIEIVTNKIPEAEENPADEIEILPEKEIITESEIFSENEDIAQNEIAEEIEIEAVSENNLDERFISDFDLHLFSKGTFYKIYDKFGAHAIKQGGTSGVNFTTWAPNAEKIYVIGEFNGWSETNEHQLHKIHECGVWSGFIAGLKEGDTYKYSIKPHGIEGLMRKSDPYAFRSEVRPKNASVVTEINMYKWNDAEWISKRNENTYKEKPMNIYEVHLGSWRRDRDNKTFPNEWGYLSYGQLAKEIVDYVKKMGYTHVELLPVMEHPLDISWGYQVTNYYAPTSRFGSPDDFMYFVDYCHQNGIGVILDWVPAHFPYDDNALAFYDGKQIYAYENVKRGIHKDWGTYIFDYGKPEVQNFLIGNALFWLEKYHADGLRVDAVASMLYLDYSREHGEWEPNIHGGREHLEAIGFLKHLNEKVHEYHKGTVMIAEESTSWPGVTHPVSGGGLGFDLKWNMGWMNDILLYFSKDPVHRKFHQGKLTFSLWYAFSENFVLPVSHDEVVHGKKSLLEKMPGDNWQKFANLRLFLGFMTGHPGKKLNFMTTDIGQYNEWNSEVSLEMNLLELDLNRKLNKYAEDINALYKYHPALHEVDFDSSGFRWIDFSDALHSVLSFIRYSKDRNEILLFTFNMTPTVRYNYPVGVPEAGYWKEILNSDAEIYGGSGVGNMGGKHSERQPYKEWNNLIKVSLPPLGVNVYRWENLQPKKIEVQPNQSLAVEPGIQTVEDLYVDTDTGGGE